tara:strand:- start:449 stop:1126 length:678 start_codon:yes stop_codon:yes gene_type:complete
MGVNVHTKLPADVRLEDAADVIGILAGLPIINDASYLRVDGVKVQGAANGTAMPQIAEMYFRGAMVDGEIDHFGLWHFEGPGGTRSFNPASTPFWIAICRRLVDFFGGELVYYDISDSLCDYRKIPRFSNDVEDHYGGDDLFFRMQERKRNLKPITLEELADAEDNVIEKNPIIPAPIPAFEIERMNGGLTPSAASHINALSTVLNADPSLLDAFNEGFNEQMNS